MDGRNITSLRKSNLLKRLETCWKTIFFILVNINQVHKISYSKENLQIIINSVLKTFLESWLFC